MVCGYQFTQGDPYRASWEVTFTFQYRISVILFQSALDLWKHKMDITKSEHITIYLIGTSKIVPT